MGGNGMTFFETRTTQLANTVWLECIGELDHSVAWQLRQAMMEVRAMHPERVVLDLSRLTFVDMGGIRMLSEAPMGLPSGQNRLTIVPGPRDVMRVLEVAGLGNRYEVLPTQLATPFLRLDTWSLNP
jgi:anti-sigma B factor antagonist